jgi:anti-anti-sigma regulatory factor/putative methionine-R-sulfoxide reductase with GAF domain
MMADFFGLTPGEKKILAEVAEKLEPHLDEILAEWMRTLDRVEFFDRAPVPREETIKMGEQSIRGHIAAMKSGEIEAHAVWMRKSETRAQAVPEIDYQTLVVPEIVFHGLCYQRVGVLYVDPSARQAALGVLSKAFEAELACTGSLVAGQWERLHHRTLQLETSAEVSRRITAALELDELLSQVVELVREALGYYHVHVYLADYETNMLVMREGTGELGRIIKERGHRIEMGRGLVGRAATSGQSVLVPDVSQEPAWLPNPLLPETCSELSVPFIVGDRVIGVLDVQDNEVGGLTGDDLILLEGLGAQIAVAIENARLFAQTQEQVRKLQAAFEAQERLAQTVHKLSTPVIQVWENVLVLPLVGGIDATRARRITEELLTGIVKYQAEMVIVDITGVPVVDTQVANYILQAIKAASLLGAHCVLVGIGAEVAQAMINLGVDLSAVVTLSNLQAGIQYVLARMGLGVVPMPPAEMAETFPEVQILEEGHW